MQETPKPGVVQGAQIYPVLAAGKGRKRLGWFARHARAARQSQGYSLPRGEANYEGQRICTQRVLGGFFSQVDGDRSAGVKSQMCDGERVVKYRGALGNSALTPAGKIHPKKVVLPLQGVLSNPKSVLETP